MGIDPRKRQKKLERQKAKRKNERRELARRESGGLPARLAEASRVPILHCMATSEVWEEGIGHVLISRQVHGGNVAFVAFLVDMYCLGVKDVIMQIAPRARYDASIYDKLVHQSRCIELAPECARKLVEGAVQYAADLGLPPSSDYHTARLIFGDINADACTDEFQYGKDGKPFFVAGPYDDYTRCQQVLRTLQSHCGEGGYHFLLPAGPPSLMT